MPRKAVRIDPAIAKRIAGAQRVPRAGKQLAERNDMIVARNIRLYRMAAGLSQTQLAEQIGGLTFQQVQKYEKGSNACAPGRLRMIAIACKIPVAQLFARPGGDVDGALEAGFSSWSYKTLAALNKIKSAHLQHTITAFIETLVESSA